MKNIITVIAAIIFLSSCKKQAKEILRQEDFSDIEQTKIVESKKIEFLNQYDNKLPKTEPGKVLVKFKNNSSQRAVAKSRLGNHIYTKAMQRYNDNGFYKVQVNNVDSAVAALRNSADVQWASPNYSEQTQGIPDDPIYNNGDMWGLLHINQTSVWDAGNFGSQNVYVGIIDEGIMNWHEDLCGQVWTNPFDPEDGIDNDGNGYIDDIHGWNWFNNTNQIYTGSGDDHGTHVAGTIGAIGGNQKGVVGVSPNVTIISCKFLGAGGGWDDAAVMALDYLIDLKVRHGINIKLTSNSWGGGGPTPALIDAIDRAKQADILFIAAAGNSGLNSDDNPMYPAAYPNENIISVGAGQWDNTPAYFSNYGVVSVDLFAPGTGIWSTLPTASSTSGYGAYSGTSMATPHVSGAAALLAAVHPEWTWQQIKASILANVTPVTAFSGKCVTGGLLNVGASDFYGATPEVQDKRGCTIPIIDATPPTVPQNFRTNGNPPYGIAADGTGYIGFAWDASSDANGIAYYVINLDPNWEAGAFGWVTLAGLPIQRYDMWLRAVDNWGNVSDTSRHLIVDLTTLINPPPPDTEAPGIPHGLFTSNISTSSITLNWSASTDNVGVTGYKINWRASGGSWLETSVTGTSNVFNNLSQGTTYEFNVQAKDAAGNFSGNSETITGTTLSPPPPSCSMTSNLNGSSQSLTVSLIWTITGDCTVSSTRLERLKGGNGIFTAIAFNPNSPYQDVVTNPGNYVYRLQIQSSGGQTFYSNQKTIKVSKK